MTPAEVIAELQEACGYGEDGGFDDEGNDLGGVDALIAYKDALEDCYMSLLAETS